MFNEFTPHHEVCDDCNTVFEDLHKHGVCFECKISTLTFDKVTHPEFGISEKELVAANTASGRKIVRASQTDPDKQAELKKTVKPTLSEETKRRIYQTHGR
jgi:hypothetical protein